MSLTAGHDRAAIIATVQLQVGAAAAAAAAAGLQGEEADLTVDHTAAGHPDPELILGQDHIPQKGFRLLQCRGLHHGDDPDCELPEARLDQGRCRAHDRQLLQG